jgi:hypothetical protein
MIVTITTAEAVAYGTKALQEALQTLYPNATVVVSDAPPAPAPVPAPAPEVPSPGHMVTGNPPYSATGEATIFGLNYDGSSDTGDNGQGFFKDPKTGQAYQTRSETLAGASLPREVMLCTFLGLTTTAPINTVWGQHASAVQDYVTKNTPLLNIDSGGKTAENVPLVDAGPTKATGAALDLTYYVAHALETNGKALVTYEIRVGGQPIEIKNWPINA